jgi:hypothetical protein
MDIGSALEYIDNRAKRDRPLGGFDATPSGGCCGRRCPDDQEGPRIPWVATEVEIRRAATPFAEFEGKIQNIWRDALPITYVERE